MRAACKPGATAHPQPDLSDQQTVNMAEAWIVALIHGERYSGRTAESTERQLQRARHRSSQVSIPAAPDLSPPTDDPSLHPAPRMCDMHWPDGNGERDTSATPAPMNVCAATTPCSTARILNSCLTFLQWRGRRRSLAGQVGSRTGRLRCPSCACRTWSGPMVTVSATPPRLPHPWMFVPLPRPYLPGYTISFRPVFRLVQGHTRRRAGRGFLCRMPLPSCACLTWSGPMVTVA
jgi:hypothetical protein